MTTTTSTNKFRYEGNGSTDTFAFNGRVFATTDLIVEIITRATDALVETLTITTDYTVTINSAESASIVVVGGKIPSATQDIQIRRSLAQTQTLNLPTGTVFPAVNVENALDKNTAILQDLSEVIDRTVTIPITSSATAPSIGSLTTDEVVVYDGTNLITNGLSTTDLTDLNAITADITTVAGIAADVTTVADDGADIGTVAGISANVTTVAGISANVTTVAGISANVTTVAGIAADVTAVAAIDSDVTLVAAIDSNVTTVAGISADVTAVATVDSDVTAVSAIAANVTTVAGIDSDVTTVAGISADVTTVANNVAGINSFAERYRVEAADPAVSLDEGDLVYNTTDNVIKYYNGSSWNSIAPGITDVVDDTTPQLGGDLDVNGNAIVSTSNGDIAITPHGTGSIILKGENLSVFARKNIAQTYTKQQNFGTATLTDGATINWDLDDEQAAKVTLGGNRTMAAPTNMVDGGTYILRVIQDGTGSRTITWNSVFKWAGGDAPDLSTGAGGVDILTFISDGTSMFGVAQTDFS